MELLDAVRKRRSVHTFDPDHEITDDELRRLFGHAMLTPSAFNLQPWRFVAVRERGLKKKIHDAAGYRTQIKDASVVIVIAADLNAPTDPARYWRNAPAEVQAKLVPAIEHFYAGDKKRVELEAYRSAGLVGMAIMLIAKDMGYETCALVGYDMDKIARVIELPDSHPPIMLIAMGKSEEPSEERPGLLSLSELVHLDKYDGDKLGDE